jgi:hypothetical protein
MTGTIFKRPSERPTLASTLSIPFIGQIELPALPRMDFTGETPILLGTLERKAWLGTAGVEALCGSSLLFRESGVDERGHRSTG